MSNIVQANFVLSMNYFVQLGLVVGLLPFIATMLLKAKFSPVRKDAIIARGSLVLAVSGHFLIAAAYTVPFLVLALAIYALGEGFDPALRSLIVSASTSSGAGTVLSTIVLMESIGLFIAGPIMAGAFRTGLRLGGGWIGLPFLISGALATIGSSIVFGCRFGNNVDEASQDDGEAQA